jgi:hypothetical protein
VEQVLTKSLTAVERPGHQMERQARARVFSRPNKTGSQAALRGAPAAPAAGDCLLPVRTKGLHTGPGDKEARHARRMGVPGKGEGGACCVDSSGANSWAKELV